MDIQERLKKIAPYAISFHSDVGMEENNTTFLIISLPEGWTIPEKTINSQFRTVLYQQGGFYYFVLSSPEDDYGNLFDAVEFVILLNKTLEEKKAIFKAKANELKELFARSSLEELKSLSFTTKATKIPKVKKDKEEDDFNLDLDNDALVSDQEVKETVTTTVKEKKNKPKIKKNTDESIEKDAVSLISSLPD